MCLCKNKGLHRRQTPGVNLGLPDSVGQTIDQLLGDGDDGDDGGN